MKEMQMNTDPFKEYLIEKDPTQKEKAMPGTPLSDYKP